MKSMVGHEFILAKSTLQVGGNLPRYRFGWWLALLAAVRAYYRVADFEDLPLISHVMSFQ